MKNVDNKEENVNKGEENVDREDEENVDNKKENLDKEEENVDREEEGNVDNKGVEIHHVDSKAVEELEAQGEEENVDITHQVDKIVDYFMTTVQQEKDKEATKKFHSKKVRPPSRRAVKRSKHITTPYTEGKKKQKITIDILSSPEHVQTVGKFIHFYPGFQEANWDVLSLMPMTKEEEDLLVKLNVGIPEPAGFNIHILDSTGTFVHNFRIPPIVSARLDTLENNCLSKCCSQKCYKSYDVIKTSNSSLNKEGVLYLLRGGRLDDKMEEAALNTLQIDAYNKKFGVVSIFFLQVDFVKAKLRRAFKYQAIKCEQQRGSYDCGVFVYLYMQAIIEGLSTLCVTPLDDIPVAMRARLATQLLSAGCEKRHKDGSSYSDE